MGLSRNLELGTEILAKKIRKLRYSTTNTFSYEPGRVYGGNWSAATHEHIALKIFGAKDW